MRATLFSRSWSCDFLSEKFAVRTLAVTTIDTRFDARDMAKAREEITQSSQKAEHRGAETARRAMSQARTDSPSQSAGPAGAAREVGRDAEMLVPQPHSLP